MCCWEYSSESATSQRPEQPRALALAACGGGGSSSVGGSTVSAVSYSGPGSRWDADLATDGSFTITRRDSVSAPVDRTVNGSYEGLASGFLKLTVASASGTDAPSAGDVAYALDVPGYALMLKPLDAGNDQIIPMVRSGECPTVDMDANWRSPTATILPALRTGDPASSWQAPVPMAS